MNGRARPTTAAAQVMVLLPEPRAVGRGWTGAELILVAAMPQLVDVVRAFTAFENVRDANCSALVRIVAARLFAWNFAVHGMRMGLVRNRGLVVAVFILMLLLCMAIVT